MALNSFFVAAEFGLVKLRQTHIHAIAKKHGLMGPILVKVHAQLDVYLSACQLGITLPRSAWAGSVNRHLPVCWNRCLIWLASLFPKSSKVSRSPSS